MGANKGGEGKKWQSETDISLEGELALYDLYD